MWKINIMFNTIKILLIISIYLIYKHSVVLCIMVHFALFILAYSHQLLIESTKTTMTQMYLTQYFNIIILIYGVVQFILVCIFNT